MPNVAKYLSPSELAEIIDLRGREQPKKIAAEFGIGLTRLYKIWTEASENKKFPAGFAGTEAGKNLTKEMKSISNEIKQRRIRLNELKKRNEEHISAINILNTAIQEKQKTLLALGGKLIQLQQDELSVNKRIEMHQQQVEKSTHAEEEIKSLLQRRSEQEKSIAELKKIITDNDDTVSTITKSLQQQQSEFKKTIDNDIQLQQQLQQAFSNNRVIDESKKDINDEWAVKYYEDD